MKLHIFLCLKIKNDHVANAHKLTLLIQPSRHSNHVVSNVKSGEKKAHFSSSLPNFDLKMLTMHFSVIILMCHLLISLPKEWTFEAI